MPSTRTKKSSTRGASATPASKRSSAAPPSKTTAATKTSRSSAPKVAAKRSAKPSAKATTAAPKRPSPSAVRTTATATAPKAGAGPKKKASSAPAPPRGAASRATTSPSASATTTLDELLNQPLPADPSRFDQDNQAQHARAATSAFATAPLSPLHTRRLEAQKEVAYRILARRRLLPFVKRFNERYDAGWVHEDICERLERFSDQVARGESPRLMLLMPPRHGKSELASKNFPAWHLGRHPHHEFIACSYNLSLAMGFSRKVKQIIDDPAYQSVFDTRIDGNHASTEEWGIANNRGGYVAAGIGGPITGKGAHVLVIDDPVKNAEEADSADAREKIWEWYLSTAYTRLAPGGGVLVIQTWWHDDDLAGRLQQMMAQAKVDEDDDIDQFEVVKYPAIAEHDEYLDPNTLQIVYDDPPTPTARRYRSAGEALHPARYDLKKLAKIRALNRKGDGSDGRWWSALYQQNPVPDDGSYFTKEQFKRGPIPHRTKANVYIAFDFAISEKKQNDWTVGTVGLQDDQDMLHVAEVLRFKSGDAFFIVESILDLTARWYTPALVLGFEDGQIFRAIYALLKKRMRERQIYPAIEVLKPITDKMARARVIQGRMQQGMVSFNDKATWFDTVRAELLRFPAGVHDDIVDSLAWMAQLVMGHAPPQKPKEKRIPSWKDKLKVLGGTVGHMAA
jgi:predicted phage terminase large subunit-like protein